MTKKQNFIPELKININSNAGNLAIKGYNKLYLSIGVAIISLFISVILLNPQNPIYIKIQSFFIRPIQEIPYNINNKYFWGTFNPNYYISMRHLNASALHFGIFWYKTAPSSRDGFKIHTVCTEDIKLDSFNWLYHDGYSFGTQQIVDDDFIMNVSFINKYSSWTMQLEFSNRKNFSQKITLIPFLYGPNDFSFSFKKENIVTGSTNIFPNFEFSINSLQPNGRLRKSLNLGLVDGNLVSKALLYSLYYSKEENQIKMLSQVNDRGFDDGVLSRSINLLLFEFIFKLDAAPLTRSLEPLPGAKSKIGNVAASKRIVEFVFEGPAGKPVTGRQFDEEILTKYKDFSQKFLDSFRLTEKSYQFEEIFLAQSALSNLLGGIGFFHGESLVKYPSLGDPNNVHIYPAKSLLTATPSRHQFPRGFLWDEGFHQLVISQWDVQLSLICITHWLNLMDTSTGWIPREQILGFEARSIVPEEFVVQSDLIANPPALILPLEKILDEIILSNEKYNEELRREILDWFHSAFPRLNLWYQWYNRTQKGNEFASYMWVGRNTNENQLNPLTLSSGLDDYPRASHPSKSERHLDLYCWMSSFTRFLSKLSKILLENPHLKSNSEINEINTAYKRYKYWEDKLLNEDHLTKLHWSETQQSFSDFGLHSDAVQLRQERVGNELVYRRLVFMKPEEQLISSGHGIMSYFPMALKLLSPKSTKLRILLESLDSTKSGIWTEFGLRSLSNASIFYNSRNTEHDPPYWRGAIWINVNYLVLDGLRYYSKHPESPKEIANLSSQLATKLRQNLVSNVLGQYQNTGYLWEQYNDKTGYGQRAHPFAGWTTIITLIMQDF